MKKRTAALLLSVVMMLSLALSGCGDSGTSGTSSVGSTSSTSSTSDTSGSGGAYNPGTYTASATGIGGDVVVEVVCSEDAIESVTVTEHQETEGIGTNAIDQIPGKIVDTQSLNIDAVSGATVTSTAILTAVADCITQAGGDAEALKTKAVESGAELTPESLETDLVIVGGGGSGMTACIRARELGLDVILVEKMSFIGGAISISGGNQVVMGSELQKQGGVTDDSVESMVEDFLANGNDLNVVELVTLYAENIGETTDWLNGLGVTYDVESGLHQLAEYSHDREYAYTGGGSGAAATMRQLVEDSGATVLLNTRATELITDDSGAVTGVIANSEDTAYTITAGSVLLATGGYGNNDDLLTEELQNALYYGPVSSTGDGILMATAIGADTRLMEYGKRYPNGIEVSEGTAKSTIDGNLVAWTMSAILVNEEGVRVVNEKASNHDILDVEMEQDSQMLYLLLDQETFTAWKNKLLDAGYSEDNFEEWLANNGSTYPIFYNADTLEELEELAGMPSGSLTGTVERYNGFVQSGTDEDFGRSADYMTMEIGDGPYYLIEQQPRFATTMGGLVINTDLQVLDTDGNVISGLYASGETVGGVMGTDSPSGANNGWAVTSGRLAAESVAAANDIAVDEAA